MSALGSSLMLISAAHNTSSSVANQSDLIFENIALYNWILMILFVILFNQGPNITDTGYVLGPFLNVTI